MLMGTKASQRTAVKRSARYHDTLGTGSFHNLK